MGTLCLLRQDLTDLMYPDNLLFRKSTALHKSISCKGWTLLQFGGNFGAQVRPKRRIDSYIDPKGTLTKPGMENHEGDHSELYKGFHAVIKERAD